MTPVTKKLAIDVLPRLQALNGWTQEKLEGLTIGADDQVYAVTDNDGLEDATGETQFLRLGSLTSAFPEATASATALSLSDGHGRGRHLCDGHGHRHPGHQHGHGDPARRWHRPRDGHAGRGQGHLPGQRRRRRRTSSPPPGAGPAPAGPAPARRRS